MGRLTWIIIMISISIIFVGFTNAIYNYVGYEHLGEYDGYIVEEPSYEGTWWSNLTNWFNETWIGQFFALLNPKTFFDALMVLPVFVSGLIISLYTITTLYVVITMIRGN